MNFSVLLENNYFYMDLRLDPTGEVIKLKEVPDKPDYVEEGEILKIHVEKKSTFSFFIMHRRKSGDVGIMGFRGKWKSTYKTIENLTEYSNFLYVMKTGKEADKMVVQNGDTLTFY